MNPPPVRPVTMTSVPPWQDQATTHKSSITARIPRAWILPTSSFPLPRDVTHLPKTSGLLSPTELTIIDLDATALRDAIATRRFSAVEVIESFLKAAAVMHQATNCLIDFWPEEAVVRARWLDGEMERIGRPVGVLHGVPISVKGG